MGQTGWHGKISSERCTRVVQTISQDLHLLRLIDTWLQLNGCTEVPRRHPKCHAERNNKTIIEQEQLLARNETNSAPASYRQLATLIAGGDGVWSPMCVTAVTSFNATRPLPRCAFKVTMYETAGDVLQGFMGNMDSNHRNRQLPAYSGPTTLT